ncbi:TM1802 family CRISPR-associated protein [Kyrpidia tusciae]|uniref:CRISPR-associated protein n=1 Tax=Kyrpidia tusciae (strain DSM 2912 / NBRC 15312 / T2) TaxID=562970 RepID=D5WUB4_KYRT2|nr:TM1802 family CRISPR-associated protein [Kyrpidia tusciae]ADG07366.1 CRISPR-associated protein [Kyrpidia tusciae DSM 2912]
MNLPHITVAVGSERNEEVDPFASLVKEPRSNLKKGEEAYLVFLTFDLPKKEIRFEDPRPLTKDAAGQYRYFGNNQAAQSQFYLVRETTSLHYLLSTVWNDLAILLNKYNMRDSQLFDILSRLNAAGLITLTKNTGTGSVALDRIAPFFGTGVILQINPEKKRMLVGANELSFEEFIRRALGLTEKKNRIVLVVPAVVVEQGGYVVLSQHPNYLALVRRVNHLEEDSATGNVQGKRVGNAEHVCSLCLRRSPGVSSKYSKDLSRTGINKIFTTKTINYASDIEVKGHDRVYGICNACYQKLRSGEAVIERKFRSRIAGEAAFILPEGVSETLEYQYLERIRDIGDFAFKARDAAEWIRSVEAEAAEAGGLYTLNFVVYRTDGKSVTVLQTIEDVPLLRFHRIMHLFADATDRLRPHLRALSLGSVYHLIPVRKTEKGQVDVQRVVNFYKNLLCGERIRINTLMGYASEALDKGFRQLSKPKIDNYENLGLRYYTGGFEDFYIKHTVMSYLGLFRVCQELGILNGSVFHWEYEKGGENMGEQPPTGQMSLVESAEEFLERQGFMSEARALFYLGAMMNRVAWKQYKKNHKSKPVLNKINFQGMTRRDILRLYEEVLDLAKYYFEGLPLYMEQFIERFHNYFGTLEKAWPLSEQANVFYLMAGYGFMVKGETGEQSGTAETDGADEETTTDDLEEEDDDNE